MQHKPLYLIYLGMVFLFSVLISSCGHLNNLDKVNIRNSIVFTDFQAVGDAAHGIVCLGIVSGKPIIKDSSGIVGQIVNSVGAIGSAIASSSIENKIARSVRPDSLAWATARGFERSMERYASIKVIDNLSSNPQFIAQTLLERYELSSTQVGVYANVCVTSRIIERGTGKKIWQNRETKTISLSNLSPAGLFTPIGRSVTGIVNMVQILSMSDEEVKSVLLTAAADAGRKMGETLREDISE